MNFDGLIVVIRGDRLPLMAKLLPVVAAAAAAWLKSMLLVAAP